MNGAKKTKGYFLAPAALGLPALVAAHPGHGQDGGSFSLLHSLSEPLHLALGALVLAGAAGLYGLRRQRRRTAQRLKNRPPRSG